VNLGLQVVTLWRCEQDRAHVKLTSTNISLYCVYVGDTVISLLDESVGECEDVGRKNVSRWSCCTLFGRERLYVHVGQLNTG
jgi:hypothetical protein